ncbi:MAG: hypothetical protein ACOX5R_08025 [bacterium]
MPKKHERFHTLPILRGSARDVPVAPLWQRTTTILRYTNLQAR